MVVLDSDHELISFVSACDLGAGRLFVLTDVKPVIANHSGNFCVDFDNIGHVASADRLMDNIE